MRPYEGAGTTGMRIYDKLYIGGDWVRPSTTETVNVINAATEEVMGSVPRAGVEDIDRAVEAARAAFDKWAATAVPERVRYLQQLHQELQRRGDEIAHTIGGEVGMPLAMSKRIQAGMPAAVAGSYVEVLQGYQFEERIGNSLVVREPIGVVGAITPWNFPLHQIMCKVAPALAAGCTVVLRPSESAPLNAFILAEIMQAIRLPPGVFNLVTGKSAIVGEALARHADVDMISFTGSTTAGKRVGELALQTVKRVTLELGGKSAYVILPDADLTKAVPVGINNCMLNSGQTCSAHTRMLVQADQQDEAIRIAQAALARLTVGDPYAEHSKLGPLVSDDQRQRVREYIRKGIEEGAHLVTGGPEAPDDQGKGYYVRPTIFADVTSNMTIAREEIFGPVLCVMPYKDEDDAVRIANDTIYGLAGGVWSGDIERAQRVARRMRTGQIDINGGPFNPLAPFGGYKQSGVGRELGRFGLEEYFEVKAMQLPKH